MIAATRRRTRSAANPGSASLFRCPQRGFGGAASKADDGPIMADNVPSAPTMFYHCREWFQIAVATQPYAEHFATSAPLERLGSSTEILRRSISLPI
jgi:hypothetical protein